MAQLLDEDFPEAEIELSVLTKMCLNQRISDIATYRKEVKVWQEEQNRLGTSMNWQFTSKNYTHIFERDKELLKLNRKTKVITKVFCID